MALREVLQFPDPRLKRMCEPITEATDGLRQLARSMCEVLYHELGIGLAAPQVGEEVRLIVVDTEWNDSPRIIQRGQYEGARGEVTWHP